jgi:hypothetical protein
MSFAGLIMSAVKAVKNISPLWQPICPNSK